MLAETFNLQGHRGARGLKLENTLVSFEAALDAGVTSIETDLHLTRDGEVVLCHDPKVGGRLVSGLTCKQVTSHEEKIRPDRSRFPRWDAKMTPLAALFAKQRGGGPLAIPTLDNFFEFAAAYAGTLGQEAGKSAKQRAAAALIFDLELKRVPGRPDRIGDGFDGTSAGELERHTLESINRHGVLARTVVRSFDHRAVREIKELEPGLRTAILIAATAPISPEEIVKRAGASIYAPSADFLDERQVKQLHEAGIAVIPWTVNETADWKRLIEWGVDGIATDEPDRLGMFLRRRGIAF